MNDLKPENRPRTVGDALSDMRLSSAAAVLGFLIIVAGSFGPWVDTFLGSVGGLRGDGKITLGAAIVGIGVLVLGRGSHGAYVLAGIAAVVALVTSGYDFVHIRHAVAGASLLGHRVADVGWGPVAALLGGVTALCALVNDADIGWRVAVSGLAIVGAIWAVVLGLGQTSSGSLARASRIPSIPRIPTPGPPAGATIPAEPSTSSSLPSVPTTTGPAQPPQASSPFAPGDENPNDASAAKCDQYAEIGPHADCFVEQRVLRDLSNGRWAAPGSDTVTERTATITFDCRVTGAEPTSSIPVYKCVSEGDRQDWFVFDFT